MENEGQPAGTATPGSGVANENTDGQSDEQLETNSGTQDPNAENFDAGQDEGEGDSDGGGEEVDGSFIWDTAGFTDNDVIKNENGNEVRWGDIKDKIFALPEGEPGAQDPTPETTGTEEAKTQAERKVDALIRDRYLERFENLKSKYPLVREVVLRAELKNIKGSDFNHIEPTMEKIEAEEEKYMANNMDIYNKVKENAGNTNFSSEPGPGGENPPPTPPKNGEEEVDIHNTDSIKAVFQRALKKIT